jgi:hypothetical protein
MHRIHIALAVGFVICALPASSQNAVDNDPCKAALAAGSDGARNFLTFGQFDKELRIALIRQDAMALAFLVKFPLRVNDSGGAISIDDAGALKTHFQEVFTPAVRNEILSENLKELGCMTEGIMYGRGTIWVNASSRGYAIETVNRDAVPPYSGTNWKTPKTNYICQTGTHRIVVDTIAGGALRYRAWKKPRAVTDAPDLAIEKGEGTFEGTNVCAVPIYTFKSGSATYRVEGGLGCAPGSPDDATGRLELTVGGKEPVDSWCY